MRASGAWFGLSAVAATFAVQPEPRFPVETEIVYLEVVVTDKRGQPVAGLEASDFALYEDRRPVAMAAFRAPASGTPGGTEGAAPRAPAMVAPAATPAGESVTFVVYADNANLTPSVRARALPGLASFLKEQLARGGARVLLVSAMDQTHMLSRLTTDPEEVAAALRTLEREPTRGHITRSDERQAIDVVRGLLETPFGSCDNLALLQAPIRAQAQSRSADLERSIATLEVLVRALGTLPGPKALLYVSGGLEQRPAIDLFHQLGDICPEALQKDFSTLLAPMQEYDLSGAFRALAARANVSRVTLYPIDASGIETLSMADVSQDVRRYVPSPKTDRIRMQNLKAGQMILAEETGGAAVVDANDLRTPLDRLAGQVRGAYAIGFRPDHEPEDRVHALRVEVKKKGWSVRHAPSYHHGRRAEAGAARTVAALLLGLEEDTLGAVVSIDPLPEATPPSDGASTVNVRIAIPVTRLSAVEDGGSAKGRLRVVIATWRAGSRRTDALLDVRDQLIDVPLAEPAGDAAGPAVREFVVEVPLRADQRELAVGVIDTSSALATYRRVRVGS